MIDNKTLDWERMRDIAIDQMQAPVRRVVSRPSDPLICRFIETSPG